MKFIEICNGQDNKPEVQGVVEFKDITEAMVEDGEHEEILVAKAEERGSGCDPLSYFLTVEEADELVSSLQRAITSVRLPKSKVYSYDNLVLKEKIHLREHEGYDFLKKINTTWCRYEFCVVIPGGKSYKVTGYHQTEDPFVSAREILSGGLTGKHIELGETARMKNEDISSLWIYEREER